jgi:putative transposase
MGKSIKESAGVRGPEPVSLSELIHQHVRVAIETAVHEELRAALATTPYERGEAPLPQQHEGPDADRTDRANPAHVARGTLFQVAGTRKWKSAILPRYQQRMPEVNEAVIGTYLAGGNTRRIRSALQPLLKAAPLSKSAVSRVIATLKHGERARSLPST